MMYSRASKQLFQQSKTYLQTYSKGRAFTTVKHVSSSFSKTNAIASLFAVGAITAGMCNNQELLVHCAATSPYASALKKTGGEVVMLEAHKEKATGILFPGLCNAMQFAGCGVRVKYGFVKVYAVGTYFDPIVMSGVKSSETEVKKALLDPSYPRTIRIVMNRSLSIEKYTAAIVEALEPRMNGQDLEKLEEFKKMNPKVDLVEGAEMEMTIRGNTMLYKDALGGVGQLESRVFCEALCDVYFGDEPVSPGHKEEVIKGVLKM